MTQKSKEFNSAKAALEQKIANLEQKNAELTRMIDDTNASMDGALWNDLVESRKDIREYENEIKENKADIEKYMLELQKMKDESL